jgi:hypothetical protein
MANPHSKLVLTYQDHGKEPTTFAVEGVAVAADGANYAAVMALMDAVKTAVNALADGCLVTEQRMARVETYPFVRPIVSAQRETKLLIGGHDTVTGSPWRREIGTLHTADLKPPADRGDSWLDFSTGEAGEALYDALVAYARTGDAYGNTINIEKMIHKGARS